MVYKWQGIAVSKQELFLKLRLQGFRFVIRSLHNISCPHGRLPGCFWTLRSGSSCSCDLQWQWCQHLGDERLCSLLRWHGDMWTPMCFVVNRMCKWMCAEKGGLHFLLRKLLRWCVRVHPRALQTEVHQWADSCMQTVRERCRLRIQLQHLQWLHPTQHCICCRYQGYQLHWCCRSTGKRLLPGFSQGAGVQRNRPCEDWVFQEWTGSHGSQWVWCQKDQLRRQAIHQTWARDHHRS